ncbi:ribonuclease H1 domain-containing protein [[Clostridium] symbiosum]|uniref:ribonuclease H1 domain-containing protein n=1 Tax=Clostridium symbiosum TaxID=1512 RepID=UPI001AA1B64C|nr:viroplasmin family protein [[Clostridium] symbiosum]MBO1695268.1 reverse transcriptase-like protein [[Clostridium] symbiosum]
MGKKKYYAVRKGHTTGVFDNWNECQAAISGYSNADFKGFSTKEEAEQYLDGEREPLPSSNSLDRTVEETSDRLIAYVDGSYDDSLKKYSFGCIFLTPSGDIIKECGNGDHSASLAIHNVAGEMLGAMFAVKWALANSYPEIEIRYDYEGIEKWISGEWKAKNELAVKYAEAMKKWQDSITIIFTKVEAHSNNKYNDMADELAKTALTEGKGIPNIKKGDYWFTADKISCEDVSAIIDLMQEEYSVNMILSKNTVAHGILYTLALNKKDKITIHYYDNGKFMVQGKPKSLFSSIITYVTELVDIEEIPKIFNNTYNLNIDKENIKDEFQFYLPNAYNKLNPKMSRVLHQAVYNLNIKGELFDGTFLAQPALRVLEGHLKNIIITKQIVPDNNYIKYHGFDMFEANGAKYQLKTDCLGSATTEEINYLGRCYTFYHNNRHVLEHWDDPTAPLDSTKTLNCEGAHDLIKRTLAVIDDFYTI